MRGVKKSVLVLATLAMAYAANAAPLNFVNTSAPGINCLFHIDCTPPATDSIATITVPHTVWSGTGRLQTRTFVVGQGSPLAGKIAYEYRIDMSQAVTMADSACVTDFSIDFGPALKVSSSTIPLTDVEVFVVAKGGVGTIGLYAVEQTHNVITFTFNAPVCAGTTPGTGESTHFFGLLSAFEPGPVTATVDVPGLDAIGVKARAPAFNVRKPFP